MSYFTSFLANALAFLLFGCDMDSALESPFFIDLCFPWNKLNIKDMYEYFNMKKQKSYKGCTTIIYNFDTVELQNTE